ncbi:MAG: type II secretion system protein [Candidatus Paceibacterota bacterium]
MRKEDQQGFSLIELLVVIAIIGILSAVVLASLSVARDSAHFARAKAEMRSIREAMEFYYNEHGEYPADANRGQSPGLDEYLTSDGWPEGPWPGSVYDWDVWDIDGDGDVDTYQISVRFCPSDTSPLEDCRFPDEEWADNFDQQSSVYYCVDGSCQAHVGEDADHPGYCVNC